MVTTYVSYRKHVLVVSRSGEDFSAHVCSTSTTFGNQSIWCSLSLVVLFVPSCVVIKYETATKEAGAAVRRVNSLWWACVFLFWILILLLCLLQSNAKSSANMLVNAHVMIRSCYWAASFWFLVCNAVLINFVANGEREVRGSGIKKKSGGVSVPADIYFLPWKSSVHKFYINNLTGSEWTQFSWHEFLPPNPPSLWVSKKGWFLCLWHD